MDSLNEDVTLDCAPWSLAKSAFSADTSSSLLELPMASPYIQAIYLCTFFSLLCFTVSSITGNFSQVDKLWSITPVLYAWLPVFSAPHPRSVLMATIVTLWGCRLTFNFYRRGGYRWPLWRGDEDYRWHHIRNGNYLPVLSKPVPWIIFNLTFISFYQHFLLFSIVTPAFVVHSVSHNHNCYDYSNRDHLNKMDFFAAILMIFFIVIEGVADNQQYQFQTEKYRRINFNYTLDGEFADGFKQSGLFSIVRKPNYAAEQLIWCSFYLFSVAATGNMFNWSITGALLLIALFQGSGRFTEKLTCMKYKTYHSYQKKVPMYIPSIRSMAFDLSHKKS